MLTVIGVIAGILLAITCIFMAIAEANSKKMTESGASYAPRRLNTTHPAKAQASGSMDD